MRIRHGPVLTARDLLYAIVAFQGNERGAILDEGEVVAVGEPVVLGSGVQAQGNESLAPGDPVILVTTGGKTRVSRAPAPAPAGYAPRS